MSLLYFLSVFATEVAAPFGQCHTQSDGADPTRPRRNLSSDRFRQTPSTTATTSCDPTLVAVAISRLSQSPARTSSPRLDFSGAIAFTLTKATASSNPRREFAISEDLCAPAISD
ncbi:hypothetical protein TIFTF001_053986 [Ficus carica]|uniref:Secreted protein n=1 Tax=Ficus carica TaxID=3494 RepID=A0AA88EBL3_FICCA|nr:hypothetical protein TIFTF001_053983 [Ficus carica]GMN70794.1 hypothetical protein TIFTF001_053984 [Ficus carica]GMN70796.1 hypothetical protein TIFTF001_053985 [Ficus carica]GMN70798.1 hypothetical protein TIFTF001_053986 [Ficus carica]